MGIKAAYDFKTGFPAADPFEPQSRLQDVSMGHERRIIKRDLVKI